MAKFCSNCGSEIQEGQQVCLKCGKLVGNDRPAAAKPVNGKSKVAAGILGIFLGSLGVHNFYLGYSGKAVAQLLITLLSCGMLSVISAVWGLIEGIQILTGSITTDAEGNPLVD